MTTTVTIRPHGHNAEVVVSDVEGGVIVQRVHKLDPFGETSFAVCDHRVVTVRETDGWAEPPNHDA